MNVVLLDYDGVVNNVMWTDPSCPPTYSYPRDNKVNNWQAVQWLSEFCRRYNYGIVVTSSWRYYPNYEQCLRNGGLDPDIQIFGKTDELETRAAEILDWIKTHDVEHYIILDDEDCGYSKNRKLRANFVQCNNNGGFNMEEFNRAIALERTWSVQDGSRNTI